MGKASGVAAAHSGGVGARVRAVREGRSLTQLEVSEKSGVVPEQISRIETGRMRPRAKTVRVLAQALGVPVEKLTGAEDLLGETGADQPVQARKPEGTPREARPTLEEPLAATAVSEDR